ncbi:MAG: glycoside hydrolase family 97 protein [Tannerella sp.]|jgi:alpha-glucosidase|nr:glycoside hydrolase family 97 protein [Tannerella sp.]
MPVSSKIKACLLCLGAGIIAYACLPVSCTEKMTSPGGHVTAMLTTGGDGAPCYRIWFHDSLVIASSPLGILVDGDAPGVPASLKLLKKEEIRETYKTRGFHTAAAVDAVRYTYEAESSNRKFQIQFQLFDDGVAFRYLVPGEGDRLVNGELTVFGTPKNTPVWFFERPNHWKLKSYAGEWTRTLSDSLAVISPGGPVQGAILLYELPGGKYMGITEAALYRYSGMRLEALPDASLRVNFTEPDGFTVSGEIVSPWRVVLLADSLNDLVNSDIITHLNPAPDPQLFPDPDWIKPGRSVWSWWSNAEGYMTLPYEKGIIDKAAELTYEYTLLDEGWERWGADKWPQLKELCGYARQKNIGVFVWKHSGQLNNPAGDYEQMRLFLDSVRTAGVAGIKIDFMDGESKALIDFDIRALQLCAERRLMVDFHGCQKPSGESRTYPNEVTREGIRGLELNRMNLHLSGNHNVALVFTRCILNNADYTPVGFSNPGTTSYAHQLATAFAFTSPLLIIAEHPDTLLQSKALPLIKAVPPVWNETLVLPGSSISERAVLARRSGDEWYLVVLNGSRPGQITLTSDFLKDGKWNVFAAKDDASEQRNLLIEERCIQAGETLTINLNSDGGYVARFTRLSTHIPSLTGRRERGRPVFSTNILCLTAQGRQHIYNNQQSSQINIKNHVNIK